MSKSLVKFRKNEDYSDDYLTTKSRGDKAKKRIKYEELKKVLTNEQLEFDKKGYLKDGYYDLD